MAEECRIDVNILRMHVLKDLVFAIGPGTSIGVRKLMAQTPPPKVFDPLLGQLVGDSGARQSTGD